MTPLPEQERAEAVRFAQTRVSLQLDDGLDLVARALLDADQRIADLTRINSDVVDINTEACNRADRAEAQLAACREALALIADDPYPSVPNYAAQIVARNALSALSDGESGT